MLKSEYTPDLIECGCDEAGRGSLAGAVFAAAVVLPKGYKHEGLNDSKKSHPNLLPTKKKSPHKNLCSTCLG